MKISRPLLVARRLGGAVTSKLESIWRGVYLLILGPYGSMRRNIAGMASVLFVSLTILAMMSGCLKLWIIFLDLGLALSGAIWTATFRR